jgi:hypothetical protein
MEGEAVLLEYDYDRFHSGRVDRFLAAQPFARYLPLVMVGSGFETSDGQADYEHEYRAMLEAELARSPRAHVEAYWRKVADRMRVSVRAVNRSGQPLSASNEAAVWVVVWERTSLGVSSTWVRACEVEYLQETLAPDAAREMTLETPSLAGVDWNRLAALALVEHRPGGTGRYDMLQASVALPAGLYPTPERLVLSVRRSEAEVSLAGPHELSWTATSDAPWLKISPTSGALPARPTIALVPDHLSQRPSPATVSFEAEGDGMFFATDVEVAVGAGTRRVERRLRPGIPRE